MSKSSLVLTVAYDIIAGCCGFFFLLVGLPYFTEDGKTTLLHISLLATCLMVVRAFYRGYMCYRKVNELWRWVHEVKGKTTRIMVVACALLAITVIAIFGIDLRPRWLDHPDALSGRQGNHPIIDGWVIAIAIPISVGCLLYNIFDNRRNLRRAIDQFDGSRARVESALRSLPTGGVRLQYVRKLSARSADYASYLASPQNRWPNGGPPNFGDQASAELAKLDEQWWRY